MFDLYQSQRAQRRMRNAAMDRGVIAILDVFLRIVPSAPGIRHRNSKLHTGCQGTS